jgi:hypothetical protein
MSRYDYNDEESSTSIVLKILGTILILGFVIYKTIQSNKETEETNKSTMIHNQKQQEVIKKLFDDKKKTDTLEWIKTNVDNKNQIIFNKFVENTRQLVTEGTEDKTKFLQIDTEMTKSVFCIQGKKDIDNFELLQEKLIETEDLKQFLIALKKKHGYDTIKTTIPSEEELLEFCDFKDFEKDLKSSSNSNIIEEKQPEEESEE